jgi:undecaprenyl diphosphate synthase
LEHTLAQINNHPDLSREELMALVDPGRLPRHMAIIMDGNGRWAAKRGLPRIAGHKRGMDVVRDVVKACSRHGIRALTLYAFSLENWRRPPREVSALMSLLAIYLQREISLMKKENIRFQTIGRLDDLPKEARVWVDKAKAETASNTGMVLDLALSYGGRWEITEAAKKMAAAINAGKIDPSVIDENIFFLIPGHRRTSGAGFGHQDIGGEEGVELPALADGIRRALFHGGALAGLYREGPAYRPPGLPGKAEALRQDIRATGDRQWAIRGF